MQRGCSARRATGRGGTARYPPLCSLHNRFCAREGLRPKLQDNLYCSPLFRAVQAQVANWCSGWCVCRWMDPHEPWGILDEEGKGKGGHGESPSSWREETYWLNINGSVTPALAASSGPAFSTFSVLFYSCRAMNLLC